ncbi:MAG: ABC transporter permease [Candidatus Nanopelagicales bacterium]
MGGRPRFGAYLRDLWKRRAFIWTFARARVDAAYSANRLGQLWQVLTPLLQTFIYFVIFGVLLQTSRGVTNYLAFLTIGVFIFGYTSSSVNAGARSISGNLGLVRALHFPRAVLPLASTLQQFLTLGYSMIVMVSVVLIMGEPLTWWWFLLPAVLAIQSMFNTGLAMAVARMGSNARDINQILPFLIRLWFYLSGVLYSIQVFTERFPQWITNLMYVNPAAVYIELTRDLLMDSYQSLPWAWAIGAAWALVILPLGFVYFWRAEATYGRG